MNAVIPYLLVALGGALGAVARFGVGMLVARRGATLFPYGTLLINLSGCFLIALFLSAATVRSGLNEGWRYLFPIGFVGAYTTFSTYAWEIHKLNDQGAWGVAGLYFTASNLMGYAAVVLGSALGRRL